MSLLEILAGALAAALVAVIGLFQAWRGAKRRERDARVGELEANARLDHARRTQAAAEAARLAGQRKVETVREQAREGRRDHFETQ